MKAVKSKKQNRSDFNAIDALRAHESTLALPRHFSLLAFAISWLVLMFSSSSFARWTPAQQAPLQVLKNDQTISVLKNGTWSLKGVLEYKVMNEAGRTLASSFRFPPREDIEETHILKAQVTDVTGTRTLPDNQIRVRALEKKPTEPFGAIKAPEILFGLVNIGSILRIEYEVFTAKTRFPGLLSIVLFWGRDWPEFASTVSIESPEMLYFDISKAAAAHLKFQQGKSPDGTLYRWQMTLSSPIFKRVEGEAGAVISTLNVPRVQIANKTGWDEIAKQAQSQFEEELKAPLPPEFKKIADQAISGTLEDRVSQVIDLLNQILSVSNDWSIDKGTLGVHSLAAIDKRRVADPKDFALAIIAIMRSMNIPAWPALAWKEPLTERLFIDEKPTTPNLSLFNHVVVRWGGRTPRHFDPTTAVAYAEGYLSALGGSWVLPLMDGVKELERLPLNDPTPSKITIKQQVELKQDQATVTQGTAVTEGPLAAELKQLYLTTGSQKIEPYLRQLFGIGTGSDVNPLIRVLNADRRGGRFELVFSYSSNKSTRQSGFVRQVPLTVPGILAAPLFATPDRVSDLVMSANLSIETETAVRGYQLSDETATSCLALTRFANLIRETSQIANGSVVNDHIQFKLDRLPASAVTQESFQKETLAYTQCLSRNLLPLGPRPKLEDPKWGLSKAEAQILLRPPNELNINDVRVLSKIGNSPLRDMIQAKIWLILRNLLRQPIPGAPSNVLNQSPELLLEYADSILNLGQLEDDSILPEHINEAARLFSGLSVPLAKSAKLHRVHFRLLFATGRYQDANIAIKNAVLLEPRQSSDQVRLGQLYIKLSRPALAESTLEGAIAMPGPVTWRVQALETMASIKLSQNKVNEFLKLYEQALALTPNNPWLHYSLATQLAKLKLWDRSIYHCRQALALSPMPLTETLLSNVLIEKALTYYIVNGQPTTDHKRLEFAEKLALEAIKFSVRNGTAYKIAGHAAFEKALRGDYVSLIATQSYLSKAIEISGEDPWTRERLQYANQALSTGRTLGDVWKGRIPAAVPRATDPRNVGNRSPAPRAQPRPNPNAPQSLPAPKRN